MRPDIERQLRAALRPLRIAWSLMIVASLAWAGLGFLASPVVSPSGTAAATPLTMMLAALGVICALATIWVDRRVITPERMAVLIPAPDHALLQRHLLAGYLVLWSLAVLPALIGFAQLLFDGDLRTHLALCAVSLAILALLMPTQARIVTRMEAVLR